MRAEISAIEHALGDPALPDGEHERLLVRYHEITERFARYNEKQVFYEFTVDDPTLYTQVWTRVALLNEGRNQCQ